MLFFGFLGLIYQVLPEFDIARKFCFSINPNNKLALDLDHFSSSFSYPACNICNAVFDLTPANFKSLPCDYFKATKYLDISATFSQSLTTS